MSASLAPLPSSTHPSPSSVGKPTYRSATPAFYFQDEIALDESAVEKVLVRGGGAALLPVIAETLASVASFEEDALEAALREAAARVSVGFGKVAQAARVALTGSAKSPGIFDVMVMLGRDRARGRVARAMARVPRDPKGEGA